MVLDHHCICMHFFSLNFIFYTGMSILHQSTLKHRRKLSSSVGGSNFPRDHSQGFPCWQKGEHVLFPTAPTLLFHHWDKMRKRKQWKERISIWEKFSLNVFSLTWGKRVNVIVFRHQVAWGFEFSTSYPSMHGNSICRKGDWLLNF